MKYISFSKRKKNIEKFLLNSSTHRALAFNVKDLNKNVIGVGTNHKKYYCPYF